MCVSFIRDMFNTLSKTYFSASAEWVNKKKTRTEKGALLIHVFRLRLSNARRLHKASAVAPWRYAATRPRKSLLCDFQKRLCFRLSRAVQLAAGFCVHASMDENWVKLCWMVISKGPFPLQMLLQYCDTVQPLTVSQIAYIIYMPEAHGQNVRPSHSTPSTLNSPN